MSLALLLALSALPESALASAAEVRRPAGDIDGDGVADRFEAEPYGASARDASSARLISGASGEVLWEARWVPGFGASFANLGDLDGDGHAEIAIGSPAESHHGKPGAGAIYVFSSTSTTVRSVLPGRHARDAYGGALVSRAARPDDGSALVGSLAGAGGSRVPMYIVDDGGNTARPVGRRP